MAEVYREVNGKPIQELIAGQIDVQLDLYRRVFEMKAKGDGLLNDHHVEGIAHFEVEQGDIDWYLSLVDSNITNGESATNNSALSIEFGRAGYVDSHGVEWGQMDGLYILSDATRIPHRSKPVPRKKRDRPTRFGKNAPPAGG